METIKDYFSWKHPEDYLIAGNKISVTECDRYLGILF